MRTLILIALAVVASTAFAKGGSHATKGYTKKDGTYVAPSHATNPNNTKRDNYSSKGNVNPHTGKEGTKDPNAPGKPKKK